MADNLVNKKIRRIFYTAIAATTVPFVLILSTVKPGNTPALLTALGSIFGFVGAFLLFWQVILGIKFISTKFSNDLVWFNGLHQKLGKYGAVFIMAHPFLKALTYAGTLSFVFLPDFEDTFWPEIGYGRISLLLLFTVWITSVFFRKVLGFRLWKYTHYLAYLILFFSFLHPVNIGTYLSAYPLLKVLWTAATWVFYLVVIYRIFKFLGFGYAKYTLINKEKHNDIFIYTFKAQNISLKPKVGQFCYIKLHGFFGEEHPFTVMEARPDENELVFGIKTVGKYTQKLSNLSLGEEVLIEGPYGVYTSEGHNNNPKVIISGGIGVTPFIGLVKQFGNEQTYMFNANRTLGDAINRNELKQKLGDRYVDVISLGSIEGQNIINGILDEELVKKYVPEEIRQNAVYFICGSKPFYENYKQLLLNLKIPRDKIYYEEFGF